MTFLTLVDVNNDDFELNDFFNVVSDDFFVVVLLGFLVLVWRGWLGFVFGLGWLAFWCLALVPFGWFCLGGALAWLGWVGLGCVG